MFRRSRPIAYVRLSVAWLAASGVSFANAGEAPKLQIVRPLAQYQAPAVTLQDTSHKTVRLDELFAADHPIILQFIYTSCTTICGVLTSTLSAAQSDLSAVRSDYRAVSITIDPDYDTPERLRAFADYFPADPHWLLLTGPRGDVSRVLAAFDAQGSGGDKMTHQAYTFLRAGPGKPWMRLEGLNSSKDLVAQYKEMLRDSSNVN